MVKVEKNTQQIKRAKGQQPRKVDYGTMLASHKVEKQMKNVTHPMDKITN